MLGQIHGRRLFQFGAAIGAAKAMREMNPSVKANRSVIDKAQQHKSDSTYFRGEVRQIDPSQKAASYDLNSPKKPHFTQSITQAVAYANSGNGPGTLVVVSANNDHVEPDRSVHCIHPDDFSISAVYPIEPETDPMSRVINFFLRSAIFGCKDNCEHPIGVA